MSGFFANRQLRCFATIALLLTQLLGCALSDPQLRAPCPSGPVTDICRLKESQATTMGALRAAVAA